MSEQRSLISARYDGEAVINGDTSDEFASVAYDVIMERLSDELAPCRFNDRIDIQKYGMNISCTVQRLVENKESFSAEMLFFVTHELFDEPLCEYFHGLGANTSDAVRSCAVQFAVTTLYSIISALNAGENSSLTSEFCGRERTFRYSETSNTYSIGPCDHEQVELFSLIKKDLPAYLGSKKAYWLKLYAVCYDGQVNCEVRINGAVMNTLTKKLFAYTSLWKNRKSFHSEKQFILLIDPDDDNSRQHIQPEKVIKLTRQAVRILGAVTDEDSHASAMKQLRIICAPHKTLAHELRAMIPEIFTCLLLDIKQGDDLKLMLGDAEVVLKKTQLRIYGYIEQGIRSFLSDGEPPKELAMNILRISSLFVAVNNAVNDGAELSEIFVNEMKFKYPADYEIF